jgi:hypothetical protein
MGFSLAVRGDRCCGSADVLLGWGGRLEGDHLSYAFAKIQLQLTSHAQASHSIQPQNAIDSQAPALLQPYLKQHRQKSDRHTNARQWTAIALLP